MAGYSTTGEMAAPASGRTLSTARPREQHWDLAFVGILFYLVIEYTRLPAMFPVLVYFKVAKIAIALSAVGMLISPKVQAREGSRPKGVDAVLFFFLLVSIVSAFFARNQAMAWDGVLDTLRWMVLYVVISRVVSNPWRLRVCLLVLVLLNLKLAQFGIRAYLAGKAFGLSDEFLARGVGAGSTGFFANSNDFGLAMAVFWPLPAALLFAERKKFWKVVLLLAFGVILGAILLSGSRGALVGAAATVLVAWARNPKRLMGPLMAAVLVLGVIYVMPSANKQRVQSAVEYHKDENAVTRLNLWKAGWRMFLRNPVLGVGPSNFRSEAVWERGNSAAENDKNPASFAPHSIYVQCLSEMGALGFILFMVLLAMLLRMNRKTVQYMASLVDEPDKSFERYLALGLNLSLVGFMVSGGFLTVLYYPHLWILAGLTVGLYTASQQKLRAPGAAQPSRNGKNGKYGLRPRLAFAAAEPVGSGAGGWRRE